MSLRYAVKSILQLDLFCRYLPNLHRRMSAEPELSSLAGSATSTLAGPGPVGPASSTADQPPASPRPPKLSSRKRLSLHVVRESRGGWTLF